MSENPSRQACETALRFLDSYIRTDTPAESERAAWKHFEECPACAKELELRTRLTGRLKQAVQSEPEDPFLAAKIRRNIEQFENRGGTPWYRSRQLLVFAALLVVCAGTWAAYERGHLRLTSASQDAYIASIARQVPAVLSVGLRDHVHCTIFRKFPKQPDSTGKMLADLGPEYAGLLPLVQSRVPQEYQAVMAHRCSYRGRKFVHITLRDGFRLLSLVIARKGPHESPGTDRLVPALTAEGVPVYQAGVQRFAIAAFESQDHLAYLVSDVGEQQNLTIAAALAPSVRAFLVSRES